MANLFSKDYVTISDLLNTDLVLLSISKRDILKCDISHLIQVAKTLEKIGHRGKEKLAITFEGYNDTPAEIFEIPTIRAWVKKSFHHYPHLFYWLTSLDNNASIILACLAVPTLIRYGTDDKQSVSDLLAMGIDPHQLPPQHLLINTPKETADRIDHAYTIYAMAQGDNVSDIAHRLKVIFGYCRA